MNKSYSEDIYLTLKSQPTEEGIKFVVYYNDETEDIKSRIASFVQHADALEYICYLIEENNKLQKEKLVHQDAVIIEDDYDWVKEMNDFFAPAMENYSSPDAFWGSYND